MKAADVIALTEEAAGKSVDFRFTESIGKELPVPGQVPARAYELV